MILQLNQLDFQKFGTILPWKRGDKGPSGDLGSGKMLTLHREQAPIFRCDRECWICRNSGMTLLSVIPDSGPRVFYYLDKPLRIHPGITFSLAPILEESEVEVSPNLSDAVIGHRNAYEDLHSVPKIQVTRLYTLFYQEKEQGFFFPGEAHPMLELTYVDQGTIHSVADGKDLLLEQGDIALYASNQWHMQYADIGIAPRFITITFDTDGQISPELFDRKLKAPQKALSLLDRILQEQEKPDEYSPDMLLALLGELLILLHRSLGSAPEKLKVNHAIHSENEVIRRAQQFISTHVRQKLSVPLVARQVDVSPSYLTALFHKHLQIAPGEYIRRIKLQESKQMIRENTMNFTEIASALQYSTVHHFSRQFKEKFGITPTEYAKSVR